MKEEQLQVLDGFEAVWQRVMEGGGTAELVPVRQDGQLEGVMDALARLGSRYTALSRRTGGTVSRQLAALARSARAELDALQLEYFLAVGDTWLPAAFEEAGAGLLTRLREAWREEQHLARRLTAGDFPPEYAQLLHTCAQDCIHRADQVKALIRRGMGR